MRIRTSSPLPRWLSIISTLIAVVLLTFQLIIFSRNRGTYPEGLLIADLNVGNLDRQGAAEKLLEIYSLPIEIHYQDSTFLLNPSLIGFEVDLESMLAAADIERTGGPFWNEFWDFLWSNQAAPNPVPLDASFSENQLREFLKNEIAIRYDKPASIAQPIPGSVLFKPGSPGITIDYDIAVFQIENAMRSPSERILNLALTEIGASRPSFENLKILINQTIASTGFDGTAGIYLLDLQTYQELHFVTQQGNEIPLIPDLPFTAGSVIKIPIMVSAFRRIDNINPPIEAINLISGMIEESGNDPADWLMEQYIDPGIGPLEVTKDLRALGIENTFLAGHFRPGSPLLFRYETPSNLRVDVNFELDPYNQTTLSDMGSILTDIYQCSQNGGSALSAVFPDEITQNECEQMIAFLIGNKTPLLINAGLPDGTPIAHKHGWVTDFNTTAIRTIGDAGIIFTPAGDYILVIYFSHPIQLVWDPVSTLISNISTAIYNYFNIPSQ